jgi:hypothetical protein
MPAGSVARSGPNTAVTLTLNLDHSVGVDQHYRTFDDWIGEIGIARDVLKMHDSGK